VDYDGKDAYYGPISVRCGVREGWGLVLQNTPAVNYVEGTLYAEEDGVASIRVIDLQGRVIRKEMLKVQKGSNHIKIELADVEAGVYLIEAGNGEKYARDKFVKMR
jgi:hypothetical protein